MFLYFLLVAPALLVEARISRRDVIGCPETCDLQNCPATPADCPAGEALDQCDCCQVCAASDGEACGGAGHLGGARCADGMECVVSGGTEASATVRRRGTSGVCACTTASPVCGSDGVSYRNVCELKRVSRLARRLRQRSVVLIQRGACGKGERWTPHIP